MHMLLCLLIILLYTTLSSSQLIPPTLGGNGKPDRNASLLWGPFRPNLYFGLRARTPDSPLIGLMWSKGHESISEDTLRHTCEQNDEMETYGWSAYDPRSGGSQVIKDIRNELDLEIDFIRSADPQNDSNWAARVTGLPRPGAKDSPKNTAILYVGLEGLESNIDTHLSCSSTVDGAECQSRTPRIGYYRLSVQRAKSLSGAHSSLALRSASVLDQALWEAKSIYLEHSKDLHWSSNAPNANLHFIEMQFEGAFKFDIVVSSGTTEDTIPSANITGGMPATLSSFASRFQSVYMPQYPFNGAHYTNCSQALLSNLLGGIGYFYGDSRIDRSHAPEYEETLPEFWQATEATRHRKVVDITLGDSAELFTMVPSRPFFPRGFLWDEGFHLLVLLEWDFDLAVEILLSWFARMDDDGWIAREQILGPEARSKVPSEFQIQYPHYANPPTLFLVVAALVDFLSGNTAYHGHSSRYTQNSAAANALMQTIFPLMKRHYHWFRNTQAGNMTYPRREGREGYRWRGRTPKHTLTSGLDDYPRALPPHPAELHVDATSWVGAMAATLAKVAEFIGESYDFNVFAGHEASVAQEFFRDGLFWSAEEGTYCDSTIDEDDDHALICHKGYVSLFPFMLGLVGGSQQSEILDLLHDPNRLWSSFGIRSLSKDDPHYGTEENYWRGPIWININYLILKELLNLANINVAQSSKAREIYTELRRNTVNTVCNSWYKTGFAWEQYNPDTGEGQRTQHFTGWTALVVKIMAMPDLSNGSSSVSGGRPERHKQDPLAMFDGYNMTLTWHSKTVIAMAIFVIFASVFRRRMYGLYGKVARWVKSR